ncbi:protein V32 [Equid alphaherpesvirus 4]|uniref:34 n=2 Tax=Equid alphaherpesvirus 4 TaxID=10331 RepID=A0A288CFZ1_EHV4|nr:protein V32 [Equid alphaherpesvirus 4]AAC59550.1 34 [Equid alphaherpesvirus 4]AMB15920.1 protein V32 [Equid alphaherpesvirus 4]AMB15999.1 protein V32 [Equid alphaherpesvirus 4]AMB16078.1 protein V32 [Equid alphaherpesvirus 4]AMB16157.1 protein V32 [Equid alphaherpesvirus 4]
MESQCKTSTSAADETLLAASATAAEIQIKTEAPDSDTPAATGCQDHTYARRLTENGAIEEINTADLLEMVLASENAQSEPGIPFALRGNFICCRDNNCRACQELPFRPSEIGFSRDPHVSMALDMTSGTWAYIPRVFPDTPTAPWMANFCIPDLDEHADC